MAMLIGALVMGPVATAHADDPLPTPIAVAAGESYGPAVNPTVGTETPTVNPGDEIRVVGANFCADTTVAVSVSPAVPGAPTSVTSDSQGRVAFTFLAPATTGPYSVVLTGRSTDLGCTGAASTVVTVGDAASGGPVPGTAVAGNLPSTGSDTAVVQLRNAIAAMLSGLALVVVASRRRRRRRA